MINEKELMERIAKIKNVKIIAGKCPHECYILKSNGKDNVKLGYLIDGTASTKKEADNLVSQGKAVFFNSEKIFKLFADNSVVESYYAVKNKLETFKNNIGFISNIFFSDSDETEVVEKYGDFSNKERYKRITNIPLFSFATDLSEYEDKINNHYIQLYINRGLDEYSGQVIEFSRIITKDEDNTFHVIEFIEDDIYLHGIEYKNSIGQIHKLSDIESVEDLLYFYNKFIKH